MLSANNTSALPREFLTRIVFGWVLLILAYFFLNNSLVHQWEQPILIYPEADNTYWLLHMLNIPQYIMQSKMASIVFDLTMISSIVLFILFPRRIIFALLAIICLWLFQVMFGSSNGHHYHHIGFLLLPLPFLFRNQLRFFLSWEIIRYWILFLFICAGAYKLYYGGFFQPDNLSITISQGYVAGNSFRSRMFHYLIEHPAFTQFLYRLVALMEMACIIGFFTHRFDRFLFWILLFFNIGNLAVMDIPFWENSLVLVPFMPWQKIQMKIRAWR